MKNILIVVPVLIFNSTMFQISNHNILDIAPCSHMKLLTFSLNYDSQATPPHYSLLSTSKNGTLDLLVHEKCSEVLQSSKINNYDCDRQRRRTIGPPLGLLSVVGLRGTSACPWADWIHLPWWQRWTLRSSNSVWSILPVHQQKGKAETMSRRFGLWQG